MRYYSKEHNRLMLSPKMTEPHPLDTEDCLRTEIDFKKFASLKEAYNTWLSSSLEIIGEHEYVDGQEVPDSAYEVKKQWLREKANEWLDVDMHLPINYYCKTRVSCHPKERERGLCTQRSVK
jgi:hypothetical protein